ncbi:MAG TPA: hypothetical protein VGQ03_09200 [Nitrososphaera sp.]|jgi:hypothetical protein|nr:hypothetical protein [Nitrososphaera sp.]
MHSIVDYVKEIGAPDDAVPLFESLDGYIAYRDFSSLQKSLEENNSEKKKDYQIIDNTWTSQDVTTTPTDAGTRVKESKLNTF